MAPAIVTAYQSPRRPLPRIGLLVGDDPEDGVAAFTQTMSELGYAEAGYVVQILKGARPGDLPVRYPSRYYLTLNNTAARNLGFSFPPALLSQADRVLP